MERLLRSHADVWAGAPATSDRAPINSIAWARFPASSKVLPTANNDSFYMSAVVVLDEPLLLWALDTGDRHYGAYVFNMWQELEHYICKWATRRWPVYYILVPPGWKGPFARAVPKDAIRLEVSTHKVWLWGRLRVAPGEPTEPVHRLQAGLKLEPISRNANTPVLPPLPSIAGDDLGFLKQLAFALKSTAVKPADEALFAQFARMGLTKEGFNKGKISREMRRGVLRGLADGPTMVVSSFASNTAVPKGLNWVTNLINFRYPLYPTVAGPDLRGDGERVAKFPIRDVSFNPTILNSSNKYAVTIDKEPPGNGFWSLTTYNAAEGWAFAKDSIRRYKIGTDTRGLNKRADGSIVIAVQNEPPPEAPDVNWLPAPKGDFYAILQLYPPVLFDRSYQFVHITQVK
jgi:hypothetical protein